MRNIVLMVSSTILGNIETAKASNVLRAASNYLGLSIPKGVACNSRESFDGSGAKLQVEK
jgi:hypothetical protein